MASNRCGVHDQLKPVKSEVGEKNITILSGLIRRDSVEQFAVYTYSAASLV